DLLDRRAGLPERGRDDLEAPSRLHVRVRIDVSVGPDRRGAGHEHAVACAHSAAEADGLLERRAGGDPKPGALLDYPGLRNGRSSSCSNRSWTAVRSSLTSALRRSCDGVSLTLTTRIRR